MRTAKVRKAADVARKRLEAESNHAKIDAVFREVTGRVLKETSDHVLVMPARFYDAGGFGKRCLVDEVITGREATCKRTVLIVDTKATS
jgi:hypothetical protein